MALSPLSAALAIEAGCESCCMAGAECSVEGICCAGFAKEAPLNNTQTNKVARIFFISAIPLLPWEIT